MTERSTLPIPDVCFIEYPDGLPLSVRVFLQTKDKEELEISESTSTVTDQETTVNTKVWQRFTFPTGFFVIQSREQSEHCNLVPHLRDFLPLSHFLPTCFWVDWIRANETDEFSRPLVESEDIETLKKYLTFQSKDIRITVSSSFVDSLKPERHKTIRCITAARLLWQEAFELANDNG